MKIRPIHDRVLIRRREPEKVTPGGIIIPATAEQRALEGDVIAVGPGRVLENGKRLEPEVKVGDRVLFGKHVSGIATGSVARNDQLKDGLHVLIREEEILGVLEP